MSSKQKRDLESDGVGEVFRPPTDKITILEEDPKHPNHHEHMERVREDDADMLLLLESFLAHGWIKTETIAIFLDGDRYAVSNGRRSLTALRRANVILKAKRDPRYPLRPRVIVDDDPALTETIANSMRKDDPPMVKARRYVQLRETIGAQKAAAALGLSLADANNLALVLSNPSVELQKAVNQRKVAIDVAGRAVKGGSAAIAKTVAAAEPGGEEGKAAAKKAARDAVPARAKGPNRSRVAIVAAEIGRLTSGDPAKIRTLDAARVEIEALRDLLGSALAWVQTGAASGRLAKIIESAVAVKDGGVQVEMPEAAE